MFKVLMAACAVAWAGLSYAALADGDEKGVPLSEVASPERGRALADRECAACHAVTPGAAHSPTRAAPSFQSLADTTGMTRMALGAALRTAHETMPNLILSQNEIDDLYEYLRVLKSAD